MAATSQRSSRTQNKTIKSQEYRPAIDGLRAIAILSVFLFHLKPNLLPGGFVGVDVFFVISGYLITSIIFRQCQQDRFSLAQFYQRRIARIFPAFFTVALATLVGAYFIYSPQDFASAGVNLAAASLSIANIKFMFQGNYFTISPDAQPFLHYWSLSVEEQFYMIFPLVLTIVYRKSPRLIVPILAAISLLSFAACIAVTTARPSWAFFLLPTRAWELSVGALLAIRGDMSVLVSPNWRRWISLIGIAMIAASFVCVKEGNKFPGYQALFPVLGAVLVLVPTAGIASTGESLLSLAPAVFIGRISYSLYLWHWPVLSLVDYQMYATSQPIRILLKIVISFSAAYLSFKLIESPLRVFLNQTRNRRLAFFSLAVIVAICVPLGIAVRKANYVNAEMVQVARGGLVFNKSSKLGAIVLMGDSNGSMYGKVMREISEEAGLKLNVISVAAGNPLPSTRGEKRQLWSDSLAVVQEVKPDILFLVCAWEIQLKGDQDELALAIDKLKPFA